MRRIGILAASIMLAACATVGREVTDAEIATLKKGQTTKQEAINTLGQPTQTSRTSDGKQILMYTFAHVQARPETFIPFIGPFVGGSDIRSSALVLTFDNADVLQEWTSNQSSTGTGVGLSGGSYRNPDRTLPAEAK